MADIRDLVSVRKESLDWALIQTYAGDARYGSAFAGFEGGRRKTFSEEAEREIRDLSGSAALRRDMRAVASGMHRPFLRDGDAVDLYLEFVCQFNEFVNHEPRPFRPILDRDMRL